ncbi:MAG: ThuA domain-containing protein, partial [Nitrospira sp.]|nr:ThuA domain-containing protein [Nitrospira sp.]
MKKIMFIISFSLFILLGSFPILQGITINLKSYLRMNGALFASTILLFSLALVLSGCEVSSSQSTGNSSKFTALVFTKTAGFRHSSIPDGITSIQSLGNQHHFHVDAAEDATVFTDENLAKYQVVIFLNTTGD